MALEVFTCCDFSNSDLIIFTDQHEMDSSARRLQFLLRITYLSILTVNLQYNYDYQRTESRKKIAVQLIFIT